LVFIHSDQDVAPFTALNVRQDGTGDILNLLDGTTEVFTVLNGGSVGIGTASPNVLLHLEGSDGVPQIRLQRASTTIGGIIKQSSDPYGLIYDAFDGNTGAPTHVFRTSTDGGNFTERARITASGLTFNGDTAAANSLDDYEEGAWAPTLSSDASAGAYSIQNGFYTKIGRLVTVHATVKISTIGSFSGATVNIGQLPFTVGDLTNYDVAGTVIISDAASAISEPFLRFVDAQQFARIERFNGNEGTDRNLNANTIDTNTTIRVSGTYFSV